jgi:hypothetical protein
MSLPFDICRCVAVSTDEGEVVSPCNTCRRYLERQPAGPRSPWFVDPPRTNYGCEYHMPKEQP